MRQRGKNKMADLENKAPKKRRVRQTKEERQEAAETAKIVPDPKKGTTIVPVFVCEFCHHEGTLRRLTQVNLPDGRVRKYFKCCRCNRRTTRTVRMVPETEERAG